MVRVGRPLLFALPFVLLLAGLAVVLDWWIGVPPGATAHYVGRRSCLDCHAEEDALWVGSDHQRAMAVAGQQTVLGEFDGRRFEHFGVRCRMFRRGERFLVHTDDRQGKMRDFEVKYTFGVRPLQQYLVELADGRVQCLPLAWDTEKRRWFHLYPGEAIPHTDVLHWTRLLQNWNYMCAECHSTNLQKNYDPATNSYRTTFSEINVSCEACHGPGSLHVDLAESYSPFWDRRVGFGLPNLKNEDSRVEIETCAPCHSRRRVIYPGFKPGDRYLDYYVPELLDTNLYYADGQILEEDYVYGSFIQSRMYRENVRCTDCHDPHSGIVKFKEGERIQDNRLCGRSECHLPATYDTPQHHYHPDSSKPGTLCVECHMAETTYMVVDPRRDHSMRIPRPDLTVSLGIPNACNSRACHDAGKGEGPKWALEYVEKWYGPKKKEPRHFAYAIDAGRKGTPEGERLLVEAARRKDLSAMVRASVLLLLGRHGTPDAWAMIRQGLEDREGLVRLAAVRAMEHAPESELQRRVAPLLSDPLRAVRTEAARVLARLPREVLNPKQAKAFDAAMAEYMEGQKYLADRPGSHLAIGMIREKQRRLDEAEAAYLRALRLDPESIQARKNVAVLYACLGRNAEAETQLRKLIELVPDWGQGHYELGLLLAEDKDRLEEAAVWLAKAVELTPGNPRFRYNLALAMQHLGRIEEANREYREAHRLAPSDPDILRAAAIFFYQQKQWKAALGCAERLCRLVPSDRRAAALLSEIRRAAESGRQEGPSKRESKRP